MEIGIAAVIIIVTLIALKNIISLGIKISATIILFIVFGVTVYICVHNPDMHKPLSLNTIEYLFKINKDGSLTTTKQVTQTVYKEQTK